MVVFHSGNLVLDGLLYLEDFLSREGFPQLKAFPYLEHFPCLEDILYNGGFPSPKDCRFLEDLPCFRQIGILIRSIHYEEQVSWMDKEEVAKPQPRTRTKDTERSVIDYTGYPVRDC